MPLAVPMMGGVSSLTLIGFLPGVSLLTALGIVIAGLLLVFVWKTRNPSADGAT